MKDGTKKIVVTGGLGFIGSCFVEMALDRGYEVINVDKMTYAIREDTDFDKYPNYNFLKRDINDLLRIPDGVSWIINFAAESHVDNSIQEASPFFRSNVGGVYHLLKLLSAIPEDKRPRLLHISTDEVYGDILEGSFSETATLKPSSPYSATKAAADMLVIGWGRTYGVKYRIARSSNNYGYGQRAEKLIPKAMKLAIRGEKMPVHGDGSYRREWTYTGDNCEGLFAIMDKGTDGEIYNISTHEELTNLEVIKKVLKVMGRDEDSYTFVPDRPGQDVRYSVNTDKIRALGWEPKMTLDKYLPICKQLNEDRTRAMPPGKKERIGRFFGLGKSSQRKS